MFQRRLPSRWLCIDWKVIGLILFMLLWWKLRTLKSHSCLPIFPGTVMTLLKQSKRWQQNQELGSETNNGKWSLGTCFGREFCSFKIGRWYPHRNSCSFYNTAVQWAPRLGKVKLQMIEKARHSSGSHQPHLSGICSYATRKHFKASRLIISSTWNTIFVPKGNCHFHWDHRIIFMNTNLLSCHREQLIYI